MKPKDILALKEKIAGELYQPEDAQYQQATKAWNLNARQHPALVVIAGNAQDIVAAVQFAKSNALGIGVMATGHGVGTPCDGGILINTSKMRGVSVDPSTKIARVEAGAQWRDLIALAHTHGLAGIVGSAPHVGIVGYTLGGGVSLLGRKHGFNSGMVTGADVVTADGKLLRANDNENPDLFWGLKGGVGNFGVVASLEFRLVELQNVYGGAVYYPIESGRKALELYAKWAAKLADEVTAAFCFMNFPPLPIIPEPLRGRSVIILRGCYCGQNPPDGEKYFHALRTEIGEPIMDTFGIIPVTEMGTISNDPVDPLGTIQFGTLLSDLSSQTIDTLIPLLGAASGSPLTLVEIRRLGGALQRDSKDIRMMGTGKAQFSMNSIGATFNPEMAANAAKYLKLVADKTKTFQTGETFINFVDDSPTVERVRAAYTSDDWERLVALKTKYDAGNLFRFNRNIPPRT